MTSKHFIIIVRDTVDGEEYVYAYEGASERDATTFALNKALSMVGFEGEPYDPDYLEVSHIMCSDSPLEYLS